MRPILSALYNPSGTHRPSDMEYTATPPMTCTRLGYTAADGVEYEIALFHRGTPGEVGAPGPEEQATGEEEEENRAYGRREREDEASLRTDPYAGTPWLEAVKLVVRERGAPHAWRGYGYATLLHRDGLAATGPRAETETYLAELSAAVPPPSERRRAAAAFWAALGFRPFRNTPCVYNPGRPVFAPSLHLAAAAADADDDRR